MNKLMKRFQSILSLLCAAALLIVTIPVTSVFAEDTTVKDVGLIQETDLVDGYDYSYRLNAKDAFGGYYIFTNVENGGTIDGTAEFTLGNTGTELTVVDENNRTVLSKNKTTASVETAGTYTYKVMGNITDEEEEVTTTYTGTFTFTVAGEAPALAPLSEPAVVAETTEKVAAKLQVVEGDGGYYLQFVGDTKENGGLFFTEKPTVSGDTATVTVAKEQINVALKGSEYSIPGGLSSTLLSGATYEFGMDKVSTNQTCTITLKVVFQAGSATIEPASDGTTYLALMKINGEVLCDDHDNPKPILSLNQNFAGSSFSNPFEIYVNGGEGITVTMISGSYRQTLTTGGSYKITKDGTYTIEFKKEVDGSTYIASKKFSVGAASTGGTSTGSGTTSGSISDLQGAATVRDTLQQSTYGSIYKQTFRNGAEDDYFFSTVRNGGTSTTEVTLLFPDDWVVTSNGREFDRSRSTITGEGSYNLRVYAPLADGSFLYDDFSFSIKYDTSAATGTSGTASGTTTEDSDEPQQVSLAEKEFADFGLYEEKLDDSTYFYTNVANGDVIDGAVWLDIPQNVDFVLTRDGNEISYKSNQKLYDKGNYFLLVWSANPISKKMQDYSDKRYGLFHFRIDKKIVSTPITPTDDATDFGDLGFEVLDPNAGESGDGFISTLTPGSDGSAWTEVPGEEPTGSDSMQEVVIGGETEGETSGETTEEDISLMDAPVDRFAQTYLEKEERYLQENRAGAFYSSVPNGATINDSFVVDLIGEQGVTVTRNDQPYEFHTGTQITEEGVYRFTFGTGEFSGSAAAYQVRIITNPVNNMKMFTPPEEWSITQVLFNGEKVPSSSEWHQLEQDGHYTFNLEDINTGVQRNVSITVDTVAPQLNLAGVENGVAKGEVQVSTISEDLATVAMFLDGTAINTKSTLTDPGVYDLVAYDTAGNSSFYRFEIKYSMNTAAYLFIILIVAIAAAVALFIVYNKRNAQVR